MEYVKSTELYHHGVLGQKWGKRNGPPYPLSPGAHSTAEKKAGWQKSVKGGDGDIKKKKHSVKEVLKTTKEVYRDANRYSMKNPKEAFKTTVSHPIQSSTPYMIKQRLNGKKTIIDKNVEEQNSGKTDGKTGYISRRTLEKAENSSRKRLNNDASNYKAKRSATEEAKAANKQEQTKESRAEVRAAKQQQREAEKKLKQDIKAEKGRELYAKGKTVEKYARNQRMASAASLGLDAVSYVLASNGQEKAATYLTVANNVAWVGYEVYAEAQKNKLRAYYAQNG